MGTEGYVENENFELQRLEGIFDKLKKKWFKKEGDKEEIDFLEFYIKQKQNMIKKITDKKQNGK